LAKYFCKSILAITLGLIIAFIISEITLRIWQPFEFRVKGNKIVLPVNKRYVINNDKIKILPKTIIHSKNSLGFRGEEPPANFTDYLTIISVGGSTTECFYLNDHQTWSNILENNLKNDFKNLWINNAGLDGTSTFGHIVLLEDYMVKLKPKVIIFLVGLNDVGSGDNRLSDNRMVNGERSGLPYVASLKKIVTKSETYLFAVNLWRNWKARKMGVEHQDLDLDKLKEIEVPENKISESIQMHKEKYISGYQDRLLKIIKICQDNSIVPVFVTQSSLYGKGFDDITGKNLETMQYGNTNMNGRMAWEILELYNNTTRGVASLHGLLLIDLARKMPKSSKYYYDLHHYNYDGAQKVAGIIYKELSPVLASRFKEYHKNPEP
jgi:lysophospholipase L1-like esterase